MGNEGVISLLESAISNAREGVRSASMGDMNGAKKKGEDVMTTLNAVSYELFEIGDAMKGGSKGTSSLAQVFQSLAKMAQMQIGLSQIAQSLFPMMGMGLGSEMSELARKQAELARALKEIAEGAGGRLLGDIEGMAGEMQKLAEDIEKYGITEDILKRQTQLLKYLLTAQKSIYKEKESVRRISKPGKEFSGVKGPGKLDLKTKRGVNQRDVLEALRKYYPKEYESLIRAYFRALSIE